MRSHKALQLAALLFALDTFSCMAASAQSTLKVDVISGMPVVGNVFVNGRGPYRFLLDTGGGDNEIDARLAQKLGIAATLRAENMTPAGALHVLGAEISRVAVGPVEASAQIFLFTSGDNLHMLAPDVQGILGQDFLRHFDYTLDFRHHRVTFGDAPPSGDHIRFRLAAGCMVVPTNLGELILDSGTQALFLFRALPYAEKTDVTTTNGETAVALARAPELLIGARKYYPEGVIFHSEADAPAAGLLPANLFHVVFVSNSEEYVVFNPNNK